VSSWKEYAARRGQPGQDSQNRIARTGQTKRDCQNGTLRAGQEQDRQNLTGKTGPTQLDFQDRTARKGLPGQDGLPEQGCQYRTARIRQAGQGIVERTIITNQQKDMVEILPVLYSLYI
jgi:hypothetical protein